MKKILVSLIFILVSGVFLSDACTSMLVSGKVTASGRPMLWKHRDTSAENNYLYRVEGSDDEIGYVGLFNGGAELVLDEAWMGMNDAGFAIMNTVAYNLPENDPSWIDREGFVMSKALRSCRSVDDFASLLDKLPKPMGVRTCFGVIDATGNGAYFETDDYGYRRFDLADSPDGVLIRTNYAYSGTEGEGRGYARHDNVRHILADQIETCSLTPASLTEGLSRCFYNSRTGADAMALGDYRVVDQDMVPRRSSTASIVVEGLLVGESPDSMMMWANVGYPPCSHVYPVTLHSIPDEVGPNSGNGFRSPAGLEAAKLKENVYFQSEKQGVPYVNLEYLRPISDEQYNISVGNYSSKHK